MTSSRAGAQRGGCCCRGPRPAPLGSTRLGPGKPLLLGRLDSTTSSPGPHEYGHGSIETPNPRPSAHRFGLARRNPYTIPRPGGARGGGEPVDGRRCGMCSADWIGPDRTVARPVKLPQLHQAIANRHRSASPTQNSLARGHGHAGHGQPVQLNSQACPSSLPQPRRNRPCAVKPVKALPMCIDYATRFCPSPERIDP